MIEMSAATVPALAQSGAILAAAPAPASSEGAQSADFSAVLAGAALVAQIPEPTVAPESEPQTPAPVVPELVAASAKPAGRSGSSGKEDGKMLPPGKLPLARAVAFSTKAQRALDDAEDAPAPAQNAAPDEQVAVDAPVQPAGHEQAPVDTPGQTNPSTPTPIMIQQTAASLQERTTSHDAPQTAELAPARPGSVVTRQNTAPRVAAPSIAGTKQAIAVAAPSPATTSVADVRLTAAATTAMSSDTVAASSLVMPQAELRDVPAAASHETNATPLRTAIASNAAPASSMAIPAGHTGDDGNGSDGPGTVPHAAVIPQTVEVIATPPAMATASITTLAPLVSTKAALVATTATNLLQPEIAQPSATPARTDGNSPEQAADTAAPALARAALATPTLTAPSAPALVPAPVSPAVAELVPVRPMATTPTSAPAAVSVAPPTPATPSPVPMVLVENDIATQLATPVNPPIALMAASNLQPALSAITAPVLPAMAETVRPQASDALTIVAAAPWVATPDPGQPALQVEATVTAPVAQSTRDAAVAAASVAAQPLHQVLIAPLPAATAPPLMAALPVAAPQVAPQQAAAAAPVQGQTRIEPAIAAQPALAAAEPAEHKRALPIAATETPATASRPEPISIVTGNDMRTAAIFATPTTPAAATTPTQDIAALVDRITEARAAAAPNTIRAALVHEDFGSVSLNFRSEASHIHVTLGSADPSFAPAVQAAAAANLANNGSDEAQHRRETPSSQSQSQSQSQPQDATRNDSSPQQQAQRDRANAGERQPSRQTPGRLPATTGERASSGTEPRHRSGIFA